VGRGGEPHDHTSGLSGLIRAAAGQRRDGPLRRRSDLPAVGRRCRRAGLGSIVDSHGRQRRTPALV